MNDINISNKQELEKEFAKDFSSPIFPILGELYLRNKDLNRAKKVCEIGLKHDPENINGYYILAKIYLHANQLNEAEKILAILIEKKPLHINALKLIIELHKELNTSKNNRLKYLKQLLSILPEDKELEKQIAGIDRDYVKEVKPPIVDNEVLSEKLVQKNINFNIQPSMATLTFVEILKEQKHYYEALHVLSLIESKSQNNKKTKKIKSELQKLLTEV